jgi:hypothetical protein
MIFIRLRVLLARMFGSGKGSDLHNEIVSLETQDPAKMLKEFATSNHPWADRFREYAIKAYGIDFSKPLPLPNEPIIDWRE